MMKVRITYKDNSLSPHSYVVRYNYNKVDYIQEVEDLLKVYVLINGKEHCRTHHLRDIDRIELEYYE